MLRLVILIRCQILKAKERFCPAYQVQTSILWEKPAAK